MSSNEIMHIEYKGILVQFSVLCFLKSWLKKSNMNQAREEHFWKIRSQKR